MPPPVAHKSVLKSATHGETHAYYTYYRTCVVAEFLLSRPNAGDRRSPVARPSTPKHSRNKQTKLKRARRGKKTKYPEKGRQRRWWRPVLPFPPPQKIPQTPARLRSNVPRSTDAFPTFPRYIPQRDPRHSLVWPEFPFLFPLSAPVFPYNNTQKYLTAPTRLGVARARG